MQVFIVSGGYTDNYPNYLSSTETWTRGSTAWTRAADLPSPREGLQGVSIRGQFLVLGEQALVMLCLILCCVYLGGYTYNSSAYYSYSFSSEVLMYDCAEDNWVKTGDLATPRYSHGASAVNWDVIAPFC